MKSMFFKFWCVVALAVSTMALLTEGVTNMCTALRVFAVTNSTNATLLTFTDTLTNQISTTSFENEFLPTSEVCGRGYFRCNLLLTSSSDGTIIAAVFPLQSGIALVSYDAINGTLVFREKYILTQMLQDCTFMYFIETRGIQGYCLGPPADEISLYTLEITITYGDLSSSRVQGSRFIDFIVFELDTLSNFILYSGTMCFLSDDGNHVVFFESGFIIDQSFSNGEFDDDYDGGCSGVSRLQRVGDSCQIATECDGQVTVFDINNGEFQLVQPKFTSGQFFVCTEQLFVEFINGTLALFSQTESERQFVNDTSFPFEHIARGACTVVKEQLVLILTLDDGRTFIVDFVQSSYHQLGESNPAMVVSSEVNGQVVAVNNGSETLIYDLPCCSLQPAAVLQENFVLVNYMSMSRTDARRQCSISPSPSISATVIPPTPLTGPSFSGDNNSNSTDESLPDTPSITPPSLVPSSSLFTPPSSLSFDISTASSSPPTRPDTTIGESLPPSFSPSPTASPRNETSSISPAVVAVSVVTPVAVLVLIVTVAVLVVHKLFIRRRRHKEKGRFGIEDRSGPAPYKFEDSEEQTPLKRLDGDSINQSLQVVNKTELESTLTIRPQQELRDNSSESSQTEAFHEQNIVNNITDKVHLSGSVESEEAKMRLRQENFVNNLEGCSTPVNVTLQPKLEVYDDSCASASAKPESTQEDNDSTVSSEEVVPQEESVAYSSRAHLLMPPLVKSQQERNFSSNLSNFVSGTEPPVRSSRRRRGSAPPSNERPLSGASTFSNSSAIDRENPATYPNSLDSLTPSPVSETSTTNGGGASRLYHCPSSSASLQPHSDTVQGAFRNREQRENQASFKDTVSKVQGEVTQGGAAEPDNSVQRQYSTNSENDG